MSSPEAPTSPAPEAAEAASQQPADPSAATAYLRSLLNSQLRLHTADGRMFVGEFKCTDNECNIILSRAFEYRHPPPAAVVAAAGTAERAAAESVRVNMTSRFVGLVVVPGKHVTKIEAEG